MKAVWNDVVVAESDSTVVEEGNHYFPEDSIVPTYFQPSQSRTVCPWKGQASYYDLVVDGDTNPDAAFYYPQTKEKANHIKGMVAFWKGVRVVSS